jgi:hypothetical protein
MSKLLAPLLFASPLALTSVIIGVNQSPVYANVEVQGAVVNLWPTTADAVPTLGQGKLGNLWANVVWAAAVSRKRGFCH